MIQKVFTIFDSKSGIHSPPMCFSTIGLAVREFIEAAKNEQLSIGKYPMDFTLFEIGEYDNSTGTMAAYSEHKSHGVAASYLAQESSVKVLNGGVR